LSGAAQASHNENVLTLSGLKPLLTIIKIQPLPVSKNIRFLICPPGEGCIFLIDRSGVVRYADKWFTCHTKGTAMEFTIGQVKFKFGNDGIRVSATIQETEVKLHLHVDLENENATLAVNVGNLYLVVEGGNHEAS
jgi:hypothetical protein